MKFGEIEINSICSKFYFVEDVAFKLLLLIFTPRYNNKENPVLKMRQSHFLYSGKHDVNGVLFITAKIITN